MSLPSLSESWTAGCGLLAQAAGPAAQGAADTALDATRSPGLEQFLPWLACAAVGGGAACLGRWVTRVLHTEDLQQGDEWRYDISRINELRKADALFRVFQPVIRWLAPWNRRAFAESLPEIQREIQASGMTRFWLAEEYLARIELIVLLFAPVALYLGFKAMQAPGLVIAMATLGVSGWLMRRMLHRRATRRLQAIKRRLPFLLDLLTLLMEAGANFLRALDQSILEFEGHPISQEFGRVLTDMRMGKTRTEAFEAMARRLGDEEVASIINSIIQGENLGTPLANVFRTQSDVLRIKRTQRAETVAGEAGVNMLLPGILVMASTVLIIIGPFALNYMFSGLNL
jgi:tight adherence protein C